MNRRHPRQVSKRLDPPTWPRYRNNGCETLIAVVFPDPLNPKADVCVREVCSNMLNKLDHVILWRRSWEDCPWVGVWERRDCSAVAGIYARFWFSTFVLLRVMIELQVLASAAASVTHYVERLLSGFETRWKAWMFSSPSDTFSVFNPSSLHVVFVSCITCASVRCLHL